jgi:hypothetical protein
MSRIPVLSRNEMDAEQQKVYAATRATTGQAVAAIFQAAGLMTFSRGSKELS